MQDLEIRKVTLVPGIGGFWVNDQPAIQTGAEADGFFFKGKPVTPGFSAIREPSVAYCIMVELADGRVAYGDCVTVLNAGYAGRPPPLRTENLPRVEAALAAMYNAKKFKGFRQAAALLDDLDLEKELLTPVAYGMSQALLSAAALAKHTIMAQILIDEYQIQERYAAPGFAGSCGGQWEQNVEKAIMRRVAMFPQSAIQTRTQCEQLPEYVSWIIKRIDNLGGGEYQPDLHFDFHSSLGRMFDNDEDKICDYLSKIVRLAGHHQVYFEDPTVSSSASEACERMASLRHRLDASGPKCKLIADEWVNNPGEMLRFAKAKAAHAFQIKSPDNGSLVNTIQAIQTCKEHDVLPYLGGSCNETDISVRATVHVGIALGAWRMFTRPGLGFDEGLMVVTNETNRGMAQLNRTKESS
ncbi:methylaspartate ammonia-lyase [Pollutimonas sp. H1-120]|uniref:methylaspartate ammonia-lyase n=1 Tax=Pollutimonas sp. H1-120 TaxID=3148824 RepID=UPI003B51F313